MGDKKITLGGVEYNIPELAFRQMRVIYPLMATIPADLKEAGFNPLKLKDKTLDDMLTVVHTAVQKGSPSVTKDALLDSKMTVLELMMAVPVAAEQAGMVVSSGEALGEKVPPSTSTV